MKIKKIILKCGLLFLIPFTFSCTTTKTSKCECQCPNQTSESTSTQELTSTQNFELASKLFSHGSYDEALNVLNNIPESDRDFQYKKLRHSVVNKIVMNLRYKVRILYEKSLTQESKLKRDLLSQCKQILESIIKNYSEYDDMHSIKTNLKQIERELAKKI